MSVATHRAALVTLLRSVQDIGRVHDHEPFVRAEAAFRDFYVWRDDSGMQEVRGWYVRRTRTTETSPHLGRVINAHTWIVRGFAALDEARGTELAFDARVEALRQAYRLDPTLGGVAQVVQLDNRQFGFQLSDATPVMFAGVLCHSCTLQLVTVDLLNAGE